MKKFVALLLAVLMVAGMFAGCGSNEAAETKAAAAAEGETAAAGEAAASGKYFPPSDILRRSWLR